MEFRERQEREPKAFSHYEMLERVGERILGKVYKGWHKANGLIVALQETQVLQCFSREVEMLMALVHPNVMQLIEYFMHGLHLVLVLEYLPMNL